MLEYIFIALVNLMYFLYPCSGVPGNIPAAGEGLCPLQLGLSHTGKVLIMYPLQCCGSRRAKMTHQYRKKLINFSF
jgi:hypothetical protein